MNSGCSSLNPPSREQPYWEIPAETESSPGTEALEDILYWTAYWGGSALAH